MPKLARRRSRLPSAPNCTKSLLRRGATVHVSLRRREPSIRTTAWNNSFGQRQNVRLRTHYQSLLSTPSGPSAKTGRISACGSGLRTPLVRLCASCGPSDKRDQRSAISRQAVPPTARGPACPILRPRALLRGSGRPRHSAAPTAVTAHRLRRALGLRQPLSPRRRAPHRRCYSSPPRCRLPPARRCARSPASPRPAPPPPRRSSSRHRRSRGCARRYRRSPAETARAVEPSICPICRPISSVALPVWLANSFTSLATTAKPRPASPARAASIVALSARRFVWLAICEMRVTTSPMGDRAAEFLHPGRPIARPPRRRPAQGWPSHRPDG